MPAVAMETSFANAGQVSPGYASPWAAPGVPLKAMKWLMQRHAPLAIKLTGDIQQYLWMAQMLRNCTSQQLVTRRRNYNSATALPFLFHELNNLSSVRKALYVNLCGLRQLTL